MRTRKFRYPAYDGSLNERDNVIDKEVIRAYSIWKAQRARCSNRLCRSYEWYGARGIKVEYSSREFIGWWLYHRKLYPKIKNPSCGRIDHSKNYSINNIEFVEMDANRRESNARNGTPKQCSVKVLAVTRGGIRLYFDSVGQAARIIGVKRQLLSAHLSGKMESPVPQLIFSYA